MDDNGEVVQGKGIGEVGDDHHDGGGQEGGQHAAHQWSRQLKNHQEPRTVLGLSYLTIMIILYLKKRRTHLNSHDCVLDQLWRPSVSYSTWDENDVFLLLVHLNPTSLAVKGKPKHVVLTHQLHYHLSFIFNHNVSANVDIRGRIVIFGKIC